MLVRTTERGLVVSVPAISWSPTVGNVSLLGHPLVLDWLWPRTRLRYAPVDEINENNSLLTVPNW